MLARSSRGLSGELDGGHPHAPPEKSPRTAGTMAEDLGKGDR